MTVAPETPLATQVETLSGVVGQLRQSVLVLSTRLRRTRLIAIGTTIGLILDLLLSLGMFYVATSVTHANAQIATEVHETCTLYSIIIKSYNPVSAVKSPLSVAGYTAAFKQLEISADHLNCGIQHTV